MKLRVISVVLVIVSGLSGFCQESVPDSIVGLITSAEKGARMNSIQADVGPAVLALINWANDALWNEPDLVKEVAEQLIEYASVVQNDSLLSWAYHYLGKSTC